MTTPPRGVSSATATESHRTSAPGRSSTDLNASRAISQPAASRRAFLLGGLATAGTMVLAGCSNDPSPAARPIGATHSLTPSAGQRDRKSVVSGKSESVQVDQGCHTTIQQKKLLSTHNNTI